MREKPDEMPVGAVPVCYLCRKPAELVLYEKVPLCRRCFLWLERQRRRVD